MLTQTFLLRRVLCLVAASQVAALRASSKWVARPMNNVMAAFK